MIRDFDIRRRGNAILVGIAVDQAVLDFETTDDKLRESLAILDVTHCGGLNMHIGKFGSFPVTLNVHHDNSLSIFVDGPEFEQTRSQSAAVYLSKEDLRRVITAALAGT